MRNITSNPCQVREFMCNIKQELVSHRSEALEDLLNRSQRKGTQPCTKVNDIVEGKLYYIVELFEIF